jgi:hypothetical protein
MSVLLYRGISLIDRSTEIVVLGVKNSSNSKTGPMLQTHILHADADPIAAIKNDQDAAICGDCPHRGVGFNNRSCYVNVALGPTRAWRCQESSSITDPARFGARQHIRLGAYGDPAAVPIEFWESLLSRAYGWTGYTHQWHQCDQRLQHYCMASVETEELATAAKAMGWRTYFATAGAKADGHIECPAYKGMQCIDCGACSGTAGRGHSSINIPVHGTAPIRKAFANKKLGGVAAPTAVFVP